MNVNLARKRFYTLLSVISHIMVFICLQFLHFLLHLLLHICRKNILQIGQNTAGNEAKVWHWFLHVIKDLSRILLHQGLPGYDEEEQHSEYPRESWQLPSQKHRVDSAGTSNCSPVHTSPTILKWSRNQWVNWYVTKERIHACYHTFSKAKSAPNAVITLQREVRHVSRTLLTESLNSSKYYWSVFRIDR